MHSGTIVRPFMVRHRRHQHLVAALVILGLYVAAYGWLRYEHDFVHHAAGYTNAEGRWVRTDTIDLGEYRWGDHWTVIAWVWSPLRWAEAAAWRVVPG